MGTSSPVSKPDNDWDAERIKDWVVARSRPLLITVSAVVVGGSAFAFWQQSIRLKNDRADAAMVAAQGAYYSGNAALAKSDLEKLVTRYPGTTGATQAGMLLAQLLYGEAKYDEGISQLSEIQGGAPVQFAAVVEELMAAGYADSGRPAEAAEHLMMAADKAQFPTERQLYRADAARMLTIAGRPADARVIWAELASITDSPVMTEARVRLGEMDAKAATP
ncbi:MAG: tetratricopeptide repeat protein [Gemmatimonadetes bacterium]|nr:tetratricopeptide repeat protein [Gemmatimonadota bacterium]